MTFFDLHKNFDLTGKVALITGASKGIGAAIAQGMAARGAHVVVSSRKQDAVDKVAADIREAGFKATAIEAKVGGNGEADKLISQVKEELGGIDILVNNAAVNPIFGPAVRTSLTVFDKIMNVNLRGPFELCQKVFPIMSERGGGSVINISSVGGISPENGLGIYSVSKAALISLTKTLAKEWGEKNIRVNAICPGLIQTKFSKPLWSNDTNRETYEQHLPLGRIAQPEEVVGLALLLASDAGSYCTGGVHTIDGGFTA
ncbi:Glucose 1-dehydrogenase [Sulfidibacter corallicola]|uniref:Glucose 1-dehydrogenase n=1 Tax=Sulfidibacter corallicola TaxID=2818388 RepID=A0A8A4TMP3_SULCO|nr:glucose 1-dehydrogenase [Sulfidibacter corallicola]QTD50823.1 glucose 1-dehydrogenase [Sulfidibacter corallicola]